MHIWAIFKFSLNLVYLSICFSDLNPHAQYIIFSPFYIYMIFFQLVYIELKFQLGLFKPWWHFSSVYTMIKSLHIIIILFLHCCRLTWEMKSHHGLRRWNFNQIWNSSASWGPCEAYKKLTISTFKRRS